MKAVICDFCGKSQPIDNTASTAYDVSIFSADGFDVDSEAEKALLFDARDLCPSCTAAVRKAIESVRKSIEGKAKP